MNLKSVCFLNYGKTLPFNGGMRSQIKILMLKRNTAAEKANCFSIKL